ncbi:hypothetical protein RchiOBHm_Chr3g0462081 [Rosa chinensis]|uniref:Uncharacterized protein n=1 Tax=Rosa chinensis TaxID=74649 RepID=A0A2P6R8U6_ROSCH|nr:hypothetical protein RchiOBHm_Chr3g0462081 [Rosa chinensis]
MLLVQLGGSFRSLWHVLVAGFLGLFVSLFDAFSASWMLDLGMLLYWSSCVVCVRFSQFYLV